MNKKVKRLMRKIRRLVRAEVAHSWIGNCELESHEEIERELRVAKKYLSITLVELFPEQCGCGGRILDDGSCEDCTAAWEAIR